MGLTVRNVCEIIHDLCPKMVIGVQGCVNGNPYDTVALYVYPHEDSSWGDKEVSYVELNTDEHLRPVSVTISVNIDGTRYKKEEKMEIIKEPVKLSRVLELFDKDENIDLCIMLKTGKYVYLYGEADTLRGLDVIQNCFVDGISTVDPDTDEDSLYIRASKKEE